MGQLKNLKKRSVDMEKSDENIVDKCGTGYPDQVQILFSFLVEKKNFQLELFKCVEQKAVQLVLFSGIMIGLILNLTNIYPILFNQINIELKKYPMLVVFATCAFGEL